MRRILLPAFSWLLVLWGLQASAQVSISPAFATADDTLNIYFDRTGTGLAAVNDISIHMGAVIASATSTTWTNVPTVWGDPNVRWRLQPVSGQPSLYRYRLVDANGQPLTVRQFFGIAAGTPIFRIGIVFRSTGPCGGFQPNTPGCAEAKDGTQDFFVNLQQTAPTDLRVRFNLPSRRSLFLESNSSILLRAESSQNSELRLFDGTTEIGNTPNGRVVSTTFTPANGSSGSLRVVATAGGVTVADTITYVTRGADPPAANPPGTIRDGINYVSSTSVILQLRLTAEKQFVYLLGDFNDWQYDNNYRLRRRADDPNRFWIQLDGLTPGQQYRFQYEVDGAIRVTDPYVELVVHPSDDQFIPAATYPDRPAYPTGKTTGTVGIFQPGQTPFNWTDASWTTPTDPRTLTIYELWVYDFTSRRDFQGVIDSLDYLQRMSVNVIELMPVQEFQGNVSWGYNPTYFAALDKAYGTREKLKELVNEAHRRGIAVVLDVVFNQTHEANPIAQLWWDQANFRPAANSPYLNVNATHPFNVFFDFNHESSYTRDFVVNVCRYWLDEFHIDGFRFDLSKGFTQRVSNDVGQWNQYDASRVATWTYYRNQLRATHPNSMLILEHLGGDQEEAELAGLGFWLWGIMHQAYKQSALGFASESDISRTWHANRGFPNHHLIGYMESHDEERISFEVLNFAASSTETNRFYQTPYNPRTNTSIRLDRQKLAAAFLYSIPGPKMLWQFGEFGYDQSINRCTNGTISNDCRLSPKPLGWSYIQPGGPGGFAFDTNRVKMRDFHAALFQLRNQHAVFREGTIEGSSLNGLQKRLRLNHASMNVIILGNFGLDTASIEPNFPAAGTYYDYFRGTQLSVTVENLNLAITLAPGELRFYTSVQLAAPAPRLVPYAAESNIPPPTVLLTNAGNLGLTCAGQTGTIAFTVTSAFNTGNTFTAELSDASGSFATPISIGTLVGTGNGSIPVQVPVSVPAGSGYRIRVRSSNPANLSATTPAFALQTPPAAPVVLGAANRSVCPGTATTLEVSNPPVGATYRWTLVPQGSSTPAVLVGQSGSSLQASLPGSYTVVQLVSSAGCSSSAPSTAVVVSTDATGTPTIGQGGGALTATSSAGGTWQWFVEATLANGTDVSGPIFQATSSSYTPLVNGRYRVALTTAAGCRWFSNAFVQQGLPPKSRIVPRADGTLEILPVDDALVVQPNPARDWVTVRWPGEPIRELRLYNTSGMLVRQWPGTLAAAGEAIALPLGDLPQGMYLLQIQTETQVATQRLLIQE